MTREISLNNPGGIKRNNIVWEGMADTQPDPELVNFISPVMGIRAMMEDLLNYKKLHDLDTISGIIERWAPPVENNTAAYISDVCQRCGVDASSYFDVNVPDNLIRLTQAIVHHENGKCPDPTMPFWYPEEIYEEACGMVLPHNQGEV